MIVRVENGGIVTSVGLLARADIAVERGLVVRVTDADSHPADEVIDLDGGWLLPGFIDTQVNGGGGVLFNDHVEVDAIATIGAAHAKFGTTAFLPTLISDSPAMIAAALDAVDAAILAGVPGVVGVHVEGPFINEDKRGIHEADRIRRLDRAMLDLLCAPRRGRVMVTLAPEKCDADDIRTLARHGVAVSAGHTAATYDEAIAAVEAGVTGFTHLFNAMSPLHHRDPGAAGAALDSNAFCGLIVDGAHLHPAAVRIAVRTAGPDRIMLVTDAMPSVGTDASEFMLQGKRITVRGGVCLFEDGTLAGAHLDMASAVRNTLHTTGLAIADVSKMASGTPARFLAIGADHGAIAPGRRADWVWLDRDMQARQTWIGGMPVTDRTPALATATH